MESCTSVSVSVAGDFSAVSRRGQVFGGVVYASKSSLPGDCHAMATPSLAMTRRFGCSFGFKTDKHY